MSTDIIARGMSGKAIAAAQLSRTKLLPYLGTPSVAATLTAQAYTTVSGDLSNVLVVTTGASDASITLMSAAGAGDGAIQYVQKGDTARGRVFVKTPAAVILVTLANQFDLAGFRSDGTNWFPVDWQEKGHPGYVAGRYYDAIEGMGFQITAIPKAINTLLAHYFELKDVVPIDALGITTSNTPTGLSVRGAIYAVNPSNPHKPDGGVLLAESLSVSMGANTGYTLGLLPTVRVRRGWVCTNWDGGTLVSVYGVSSHFAPFIGGATPQEAVGVSTSYIKGWTATQAYGAMPATFPTSTVSTANSEIPAICLRCA